MSVKGSPKHSSERVHAKPPPEEMDVLYAGLMRSLAPDAPEDAFAAWLQLARRWGFIDMLVMKDV